MGCLNCGKDLIQITGKRAKTFCSVTCRSNYWQKKNRDRKGTGKAGRPKKGTPKISTVEKDFPNVVWHPDVHDAMMADAKQTGVKIAIQVPKKDLKKYSEESFMGHPIPKGLKGIELSIWKAEIKENGIHKG